MQSEYDQPNVKCRLKSFNSLIAILFYFILFYFIFFCKKETFYSKNIQYASNYIQYNFYGADLYVNVLRAFLEPSRTSTMCPFKEITKKLYCRCSNGF